RGAFWGGELEGGLEMPEHRRRHRLKRVERPPGHLEHADLQGNGQAMLVAIPRENRRTLLGGKGKEVTEFEISQYRRNRLEIQERDTPVLHNAPSHGRMTPRAVHRPRPWC